MTLSDTLGTLPHYTCWTLGVICLAAYVWSPAAVLSALSLKAKERCPHVRNDEMLVLGSRLHLLLKFAEDV